MSLEAAPCSPASTSLYHRFLFRRGQRHNRNNRVSESGRPTEGGSGVDGMMELPSLHQNAIRRRVDQELRRQTSLMCSTIYMEIQAFTHSCCCCFFVFHNSFGALIGCMRSEGEKKEQRDKARKICIQFGEITRFSAVHSSLKSPHKQRLFCTK